jgi:hypothetical protein
VDGDGSPVTSAWVASLESRHYAAVEAFFRREASRYGLALDRPVAIRLGQPVAAPPAAPSRPGPLSVAAWSLRLRFWAWWTLRGQPGPRPQVRMFALFHDPSRSPAIPDSVGIQKGLIGIAHGYADAGLAETNGVVLAHELLHSLGATDKFDPATNLPAWPDVYGEPERDPLHPQTRAELMAGRLPVGPLEAAMPEGFDSVVIGTATAREIRWTR